MKLTKLLTVFIIILSTIPIEATLIQEVTLHVAADGNDSNQGTQDSPFASLIAAKNHVRQLIAAGLNTDVRVVVHSGTYFLDESLVFSYQDAPSPKYSIAYSAAANEVVIVSGGIPISKWERDRVGRWVADLPRELPAPETIRQLFYADETLHRARTPNEGYFRVTAAGEDHRTSFQFDPNQWQPSGSMVGAEIALLHDWSMSRILISERDATSHTVKLANRVGAQHDFFRIDGFEANPRFFVENARELLDAKGEFFCELETRKVFANFDDNEPPKSNQVIVPRLQELIRIEGTPENPVSGLRFEGLQFRHTLCAIPSTGYAGIQASFFETRRTPENAASQSDPTTESGHSRVAAAITSTNAENCKIFNCHLSQIGGGAIYLDRQTDHFEINACTINDVGGCGIMIGETVTRPKIESRDESCHHNSVDGCTIKRCGQILFGSVGIWIGIANNTTIKNCNVSELPYSGVSVGWRWDDQPSGCFGNQIRDNEIDHVMQILSDGAGIYTLGRQSGTALTGNRIHNIPINAGRAESNGIFMDEGSTEILVEGNTIFQTARSPIRFHKAGRNEIRENRLLLLPGIEPFTFNSTPQEVIVFTKNDIQNAAKDTPDN